MPPRFRTPGGSDLRVGKWTSIVNAAEQQRNLGEVTFPGRCRCRQAPGLARDVLAFENHPVSDADCIRQARRTSRSTQPFKATDFVAWQTRKERVLPVLNPIPAHQVVRTWLNPPDMACPAAGQERPSGITLDQPALNDGLLQTPFRYVALPWGNQVRTPVRIDIGCRGSRQNSVTTSLRADHSRVVPEPQGEPEPVESRGSFKFEHRRAAHGPAMIRGVRT